MLGVSRGVRLEGGSCPSQVPWHEALDQNWWGHVTWRGRCPAAQQELSAVCTNDHRAQSMGAFRAGSVLHAATLESWLFLRVPSNMCFLCLLSHPGIIKRKILFF